MLLLNTTLNSSITNNITTNWSPCDHLWGLMTDFSPTKTSVAERPNTLHEQWTKTEHDRKTEDNGTNEQQSTTEPTACCQTGDYWCSEVYRTVRLSCLCAHGQEGPECCGQKTTDPSCLCWAKQESQSSKCDRNVGGMMVLEVCVTAVSVGFRSKNINQCGCLICANRDLLYSPVL